MTRKVDPVLTGRPHVPEYGIPEHSDGLLPWSFALERLDRARNYWIATTRPDGRPHAVPVWGVLVDGEVYFGGGPQTVWARNLARSPQIVVHLESGDEVVILEGTAERHTENNTSAGLLTRIDDAYEAKYDMRHGTPVWRLVPRVGFAWSRFPDDTTRWAFASEAR